MTSLTVLDGWKTYLLCGIAVIVVLVNQFIGQIPGTPPSNPDWLSEIWQILLVATGRSALKKVVVPDDQSNR